MNEKLLEIGKIMQVNEKEIKDIARSSSIIGKAKLILPNLVIIIASAILGLILGGNNPVCINCEGYPYSRAMVAPGVVSTMSKREKVASIFVTLLFSIIAFVSSYKLGQQIFGYAIKYDAYRR